MFFLASLIDDTQHRIDWLKWLLNVSIMFFFFFLSWTSTKRRWFLLYFEIGSRFYVVINFENVTLLWFWRAQLWRHCGAIVVPVFVVEAQFELMCRIIVVPLDWRRLIARVAVEIRVDRSVVFILQSRCVAVDWLTCTGQLAKIQRYPTGRVRLIILAACAARWGVVWITSIVNFIFCPSSLDFFKNRNVPVCSSQIRRSCWAISMRF